MRNDIWTTQLNTQLEETTILGPKKTKKGIPLSVVLTLTSLIDVFAILVIYLLVNMSGVQSQIEGDLNVNLPNSQAGSSIDKGYVVKIKSGKIIVDEKVVSIKKFKRNLKKLVMEDENTSVVVLADKKTSFNYVNPVLLAASSTGVKNLKFAVFPGGETL